uniref:DDE Tnp4 domain-containing protein n=1 Tax=Fagus sylvatica TaxID=28930 RepID=A0A2N9F793_FAGSY
MKDLGPLHYFLGIEVIPFSGGLFLSQQKYACDILARSSMTGCNPIGTPLAQKHNLRRNDPILVDATNYRSIVGALQYITLSRPDLTHAINMGTLDYGLRLLSRSSLSLYGFSDADWAGCLDTRCSTTGYCIYLGANCISWASKKQATVSRSSAEAEYRSMSTTTAELTWILYLLRDIGINLSTPPVLFCDNTSALHLTVNPVFHARTKHIELDVHFVREKVAAGALVTRFVPTHLQIADVFTKALSKEAFQRLRSKLGVMLPPTSSLRGRALDGTYIKVNVLTDDRPRYRTRKNEIATNVLGVCTQDMKFIYVLTEWDDSTADSRVIRDAVFRTNGLRVPKGFYYLCDAGYINGEGFLAPYRAECYHLNKWTEGHQPNTPREFFNMKHCLARNVIEWCFGLLKGRRAILRRKSFYPIRIQCRIHNHIRRKMPIDPLENELSEVTSGQGIDGDVIRYVETSDIWSTWRDVLAKEIFNKWRGARH